MKDTSEQCQNTAKMNEKQITQWHENIILLCEVLLFQTKQLPSHFFLQQIYPNYIRNETFWPICHIFLLPLLFILQSNTLYDVNTLNGVLCVLCIHTEQCYTVGSMSIVPVQVLCGTWNGIKNFLVSSSV